MDAVPAIATCDGGLELTDVHVSTDGTRKLLFRADGMDGSARVETVLIPITRAQACPRGCSASGAKYCKAHHEPLRAGET